MDRDSQRNKRHCVGDVAANLLGKTGRAALMQLEGKLMAKKARTPSNVPSKKRMRDIADRLWSRAVRDDWAWRCAVCGNQPCEAHHLVPRQHQGTRYDLTNGISLCAHCHQFSKDISPHQNAAGWLKWLKDNQPERHDWLLLNLRPEFTGTTNTIYYCDLICGFREYFEPDEFERLVGIRFNRYLLEDYVK